MNRKAIILAGAPGAGKGSILKDLDLSGLQVLNLDDTILALSKEQGFSLDQKTADAENRSAFMKAMAAATKKLKGEQIPQTISNGDSFILDGTAASSKQTQLLVDQLKEADYDVMMLYVYTHLETSLKRNQDRFEKSGGEDRSLMPGAVLSTWLSVAKNFKTYQDMFGKNFVSVANTGESETMKDIEKITKTYLDPFTPTDSKPKTPAEEKRSIQRKEKLNAELQDFLNSSEVNNIIDNSISKEEAQSKISSFLKADSLSEFLVKSMLEANAPDKVALFGGSFKPPTSGHLAVVLKALRDYPDITKVNIFVGSGARNNISQEEAMKIWEMYKQYIPKQVSIIKSGSPIKDIMNYLKDNRDEQPYVLIGAREGNEEDEKDYEYRSSRFEREGGYPLKITTKNEVSGTKARAAAKESKEAFLKFIPPMLSNEEKDEIFGMIQSVVKEDIDKFLLEDSKFLYEPSLQEKLVLTLNEIILSTDNAVDIDGDLTKGEFIVDLNTYTYEINPIKNVYGDGGSFYNVSFYPKDNKTSKPLEGKENYIKVLSTMYKVITDFLTTEKPDYLGIGAFDGKQDKNYHSVYSALTRNKSNNIKGYMRKDVSVPFYSPKHGDGKMVVLKKEKQLNENASYSKDIDLKGKIDQLTQHMIAKGMNIEPLPSVEFIDGDTENARDFFGKTAYYDPEARHIVLYTEGRHPKDIARSYAHEMIHHIQNLEGRLHNITTTNTHEDDALNDIEAEANLKGTMTFRNWTDSLNENQESDRAKFIKYLEKLIK